MGSPWGSKRYGKNGVEVSDLFPHMGGVIDDLCVIRSMTGDHNDHFQATMGVHTGSVTVKRPSIGSWVSYGLARRTAICRRSWSSRRICPTRARRYGRRISCRAPLGHSDHRRRRTDRRSEAPRTHRSAPRNWNWTCWRGTTNCISSRGPEIRRLAARIKSFETAFGMQSEMPEVFDFSKESDETLKLYGLERGQNSGFAWQCLVARRLAERGVRFVELIDTGSNKNWDFHSDLKNMTKLAASVDQPIAGLITDLKSRGMLDDTLVVWTTEFGRTPWGTPASTGQGTLQQGLQLVACGRRHKAGNRLRLVR